MTIFSTRDGNFFDKCRLGLYSDAWRAASWFGYSSSIGTTRVGISPGAFPVTFPSEAGKVQCSSSSANDTLAGTGARKIVITGLDANYDEIVEEVELAGQTGALTTKDFIRINGAYVSAVGTGLKNAGNIWLSVAGTTLTAGVPQGDANKLGIIATGDNKSAMAWATVPNGHRAHISCALVSVGADKVGEISFWAQEFGSTLQRGGGIELKSSPAFSSFCRNFEEKTDLIVQGKAALASTSFSAYYSYLLFKV